MVKKLPVNAGEKAPLEEGMATHSSILRDFHGQRSLAGDGPWGRKSQTHELATEHARMSCRSASLPWGAASWTPASEGGHHPVDSLGLTLSSLPWPPPAASRREET